MDSDLFNLVKLAEAKLKNSHPLGWESIKNLATLSLSKQLFIGGRLEEILTDNNLSLLLPELTEIYLSFGGLECLYRAYVLEEFKERLVKFIADSNQDDGTEFSAHVTTAEAESKLSEYPWLLIVFLYRYYLMAKE